MSTLSAYTDVRVGVPQGSVLGPLLYIIFANDLTNIIHNVNITTYADDIALFSTSNSLNELIDKFNHNLNIVQNWSLFNFLPVNYGKCHAVLISNRHIANIPTLSIGDYSIPIKQTTNYLGIHIDSRLTFKTHLDFVELRL